MKKVLNWLMEIAIMAIVGFAFAVMILYGIETEMEIREQKSLEYFEKCPHMREISSQYTIVK